MARRQCLVCGCTDDAPCVISGVPCCWVGAELCSACASVEQMKDDEQACQWLGAIALASLRRLSQRATVTGRVVSRSEIPVSRRSPCSPTGRCGTSPPKT